MKFLIITLLLSMSAIAQDMIEEVPAEENQVEQEAPRDPASVEEVPAVEPSEELIEDLKQGHQVQDEQPDGYNE